MPDGHRISGDLPVADRVLAGALRKAGFNPASERLQAIARQVIQQHPRNWDAARDALNREVRSDAALLWALFEPWFEQAAQKTLSRATAQLRRADQAAATPRGGAGHGSDDSQGRSARPTTPSTAGAEAVAAVARRSILDTFRINGQPLGDVTAREASAWAAATGRRARFVARLVENLPPGDPIRRWRTPDDAEALHAEIAKDAADAA